MSGQGNPPCLFCGAYNGGAGTADHWRRCLARDDSKFERLCERFETRAEQEHRPEFADALKLIAAEIREDLSKRAQLREASR